MRIGKSRSRSCRLTRCGELSGEIRIAAGSRVPAGKPYRDGI